MRNMNIMGVTRSPNFGACVFLEIWGFYVRIVKTTFAKASDIFVLKAKEMFRESEMP